MSRLRQIAQQICDSKDDSLAKRFKTGNGSAVISPIGPAVEAEDAANTCVVVVKGKAVPVYGVEAVAAAMAAENFTKDHTQGAPGSLALARVPTWQLVRAYRDFQELLRMHEASPLERPVEACLLLWRDSRLPWCDFSTNTLFGRWLPAEQAGGLQPSNCVWVLSHLGRGTATLADAGCSKAGTAFSACLLENGLLPGDSRLVFSRLVPSSNEEVQRQHWEAAEQMEAEEAEDEAAAPARQLQARLEHVRLLAAAHAAVEELPAEQLQVFGPPPLVQPPPPLPPGRGPDPVIKDEWDEQAALMHQLILLTVARICRQHVRALLLATPLAVPVMCGVEASDAQVLGIATPPPLRPEVVACLPPASRITVILTPYPTCFGARVFVDKAALERVLANFQARSVLAAVQHTVSLERCVQAVGEARRALGEEPPPLEQAYAAAMGRLQAVDGPHLHCMALPGGCRGDLPALVLRALELAPVLGTEFELGEERDRRRAKHCKLAAQPPPANQFTRDVIKLRDEELAAFMAPRLEYALQLQRAALVAPPTIALQAVGAGSDNALMVAGHGAMDPLHIRIGDRLIAHQPQPDGKLEAFEVVGVEAYLVRNAVRISQVLARNAEKALQQQRVRQMKVVLCLEGEYPDAPLDWAHRLLLAARECCAQVYSQRELEPDEYLPSVGTLLSISVEQLGYLTGGVLGDGFSRDGSMIFSATDRTCAVLLDYCRLLGLLGLQPVASHDDITSIRVRGSTASGGRRCEQSWVLGADCEPLLDEQGQRVRPLANDWDVNILVQFLLLAGVIDGSSRTLQPRTLSCLHMQPPRFLLAMLGGAVDTDGWYNKQHNANLFGQGRLCGHETQVGSMSAAALRCGLGGLVTVSSGAYHVRMRGVRLPELRAFIKVPHKRPPEEVPKTKFMRAGLGLTYQRSDPHLRHFQAQEQEGLQLCVHIRLAGRAQLVRAACGAGLLLGG